MAISIKTPQAQEQIQKSVERTKKEVSGAVYSLTDRYLVQITQRSYNILKAADKPGNPPQALAYFTSVTGMLDWFKRRGLAEIEGKADFPQLLADMKAVNDESLRVVKNLMEAQAKLIKEGSNGKCEHNT